MHVRLKTKAYYNPLVGYIGHIDVSARETVLIQAFIAKKSETYIGADVMKVR